MKRHKRTADLTGVLCGAQNVPENNRCRRLAPVTCKECRFRAGGVHPQKGSGGRPKGSVPPIEETRPDWSRTCEVCGGTPIMPVTGMCGPCTFGEAETVGGNW